MNKRFALVPPRSLALKIASAAAVHVAAAVLLAALYGELGLSALAISAFPVGVTAWLFGAGAGIGAALVVSLVVDPSIEAAVTDAGPHLHAGDIAPTLAVLFLAGLVGRLRDLREELRRRAAVLREHTDLYEGLLEAQSELGHAVLVVEGTGPGGRILFANDGLERITGYGSEELRDLAALRPLVTPESLTAYHARTVDGVTAPGELEIIRRDGAHVTLEVAARTSTIGGVTRRLIVARDITERRRARAALERRALYDGLTGVANRALLSDRLEQALAAARRGEGAASLLVLDLDDFKDVNDAYGHAAGDALLAEVAGRLRATLRESDTVARLGGDEFAVLLPGSDEVEAQSVAARVVAALRAPAVVEGRHLYADASIGVAAYPAHGADAAALLRAADLAMYDAKRAGARIVVYRAPADDASGDRVALAADLREALAADALTLHYQPIVDLDGRVCALEALARWRHPVRGDVSPVEFIPIAERTGLVKPFGEWVLREGMRQVARWRAAGLDVKVRVNLSGRNLRDPELAPYVRRTLAETGAPPESFGIEITESSFVGGDERVLRALEELRDLGIGIAIDDFGTGATSLSYLGRLPVGALKIDKSFVREMLSDRTAAAIVDATITLAHGTGLVVVAEGVERREQWLHLARLGCDRIQGYLVSRPMPVDAATAWLSESPWAAARVGGPVTETAVAA